LELPPGMWGNLWSHLQQGRVLARLGLCALTAILLMIITRAWAPPLPYRLGDIPQRDIVARTQFEKIDEAATRKAHEDARRLAIAIYDQDPAPIDQMRARLESEVSQLLAAKDFSEAEALWDHFKLQYADAASEPNRDER